MRALKCATRAAQALEWVRVPACNTLVPAPRRLPAVPKVRKCERDRSIYLDFSSVTAPYRQVVGRGDFVERHACR